MDFLLFFLGYVGIFIIVAIFVMFFDSTPFISRISEKLKLGFFMVVYKVVPPSVIRGISKTINYVFNTRNHVMQLVFGLLVMGGHIIFMLEILPLLYIFEPDENHILLPLVFLFTNAAAFHFSCASDPGSVTPVNAAMLASLYKADGIMFKAGAECGTCKQVKPPRSKHCRICDRCIHRFDHHCIWTNNCVGAGNLRFFLAYLISLLVMVVNGAIQSTRAMYLMVKHLKMMETGYVDPATGQVLPITIPVLIQHLFMRYPRCIFLITSLFMLTVLLGLFTFYHLYLVVSNQTTNERYKMVALPVNNNCHDSSITSSQEVPGEGKNSKPHSVCQENTHILLKQEDHHQDGRNRHSYLEDKQNHKKNRHSHAKAGGDFHEDNNNRTSRKDTSSLSSCSANGLGSFYNRGIFYNVKEVLLPWADLYASKHPKVNVAVHGGGQKKVKKR